MTNYFSIIIFLSIQVFILLLFWVLNDQEKRICRNLTRENDRREEIIDREEANRKWVEERLLELRLLYARVTGNKPVPVNTDLTN